jgi:hypothetical protein
MPTQVTLSSGKAVAVPLAFEGTELPVKVIDFTTATLVSTTGHLYSAGLVMEMGCWPGVMTNTYDAWVHVGQQRLCGNGTENPGVAGVNGIVIMFNVDDVFTQAAGINFSIGDRSYFTATS